MSKIFSRMIFMAALLAAIPVHGAEKEVNVLRDLEMMAMERLEKVKMMEGSTLAPFKSDGCSAGMSAAWEALAELFPRFREIFSDKTPWEECCVEHDRAYWKGSTDNGYERRLISDTQLRECVLDTGAVKSRELASKLKVSEDKVFRGFQEAATAMYEAVRIGGAPCTGLDWRWGHGWPNCLIIEEKPPRGEKY